MDWLLYIALSNLLHGFSLAQLYCPDCKTHEGWLDCHPGPHNTCHANEVCQVHVHGDPHHGMTMETGCRPHEHCFHDELHDPVRCADGLIDVGPHGCIWCCNDLTCVDKYRYMFFPGQYSTQPVPTPSTTPAPVTSPVPQSTAPPVITANCYVCEGDTSLTGCMGKPHDCDLTQEVCMVNFQNGTLNAGCRSDQFCTSEVQNHNTADCYSGKIDANGVCYFCCEVPGCMETVLIPKLPSGVLGITAPPITTQRPTTAPPTTIPTTAHPLGPNGEINCHVCEDAHHLDDCLRHPTYCHLDRNEICMVEHDPHGRVHSRCEHNRNACLDRELHNPLLCLISPRLSEGHRGPPGPPGHEDNCVFCCETTDCFHQSVGSVLIGR